MTFRKNFGKGCLIVVGTYFVLSTIAWKVIGIGRYLDDVRFRADVFGVETSAFETFLDGFGEALRGFKWFGTGIMNCFKKG